jgi:hypothetical protein
MSTWSKLIRQPLGTILPLSEVKRRVIVDVHDKCGGNYLLAPHLLGIGRTPIYRLVRMYRYQQPRIQAEQLMSISQCESSFDPSSKLFSRPSCAARMRPETVIKKSKLQKRATIRTPNSNYQKSLDRLVTQHSGL